MDIPASDWSLVIQSVVQIFTIIGGIWAIFSKKTSDMEKKFEAKFNNLEYQVKSMNAASQRREEIVKPTKFDV